MPGQKDHLRNHKNANLVLLTQKIVPYMVAEKNGHIVNISSLHGIHGVANGTAYCATKFALMGFTEALSYELYKDGVKVSVVCPGGVLTQFTGVPPEQKNQEFLEPEEIAQVVLDVVSTTGKALVQKISVSPKTIPFVAHERRI